VLGLHPACIQLVRKVLATLDQPANGRVLGLELGERVGRAWLQHHVLL